MCDDLGWGEGACFRVFELHSSVQEVLAWTVHHDVCCMVQNIWIWIGGKLNTDTSIIINKIFRDRILQKIAWHSSILYVYLNTD